MSNALVLPSSVEDYLRQLAFRNNTNLRPAGMEVALTKSMFEELKKCRKDPIYFIKKYIKIVHVDRGLVPFELYPYQEKMVHAYAGNRKVITMLARQMGKCLGINTKVSLRQKSTGNIVEVTLGEFYEWQRFKETVEQDIKEGVLKVSE